MVMRGQNQTQLKKVIVFTINYSLAYSVILFFVTTVYEKTFLRCSSSKNMKNYYICHFYLVSCL